MSLQDEINKWAKSDAGRKKIEAAKRASIKSGKPFESGGGGKPPNYYAQRLIEILSQEISDAGFEFGDYLYWVDEGYNEAEKRHELHVNFKHEEIGRPSLDPETYQDGAYDIVSLTNHGYRANGSVHGKWHDKETWSLRERDGAFFIQKAISEFNLLYGREAYADYSDKY